MRRLVLVTLPWLALLHWKNWRHGRWRYPQLWNCLPRWRLLRRALPGICGVTTGHELSATEWGYGGGKYVDCWCRWCNKLIQVPKEESPVRHPALEGPATALGFYDG